jgi:hypothetical protein
MCRSTRAARPDPRVTLPRAVRKREAHQRVDQQLQRTPTQDRHHHDAIRTRHLTHQHKAETLVQDRSRAHVINAQRQPHGRPTTHRATVSKCSPAEQVRLACCFRAPTFLSHCVTASTDRVSRDRHAVPGHARGRGVHAARWAEPDPSGIHLQQTAPGDAVRYGVLGRVPGVPPVHVREFHDHHALRGRSIALGHLGFGAPRQVTGRPAQQSRRRHLPPEAGPGGGPYCGAA